MKRIDISNSIVNNWEVGQAIKHSNGKLYYQCKCKLCGKEREVEGYQLRSGKSKSCGCTRNLGNVRELTGKQFGHLFVEGSEVINNRTVWRCRCDCGNVKLLEGKCILSGNVKSCGCRPDSGERIKSSLSKYLVDGTYLPMINKATVNRNNTSGVTGVGYRPDRGKWRAYIKFQGKNISLGNWDTKELAIMARKAGELEYFGKYLEESNAESRSDQM